MTIPTDALLPLRAHLALGWLRICRPLNKLNMRLACYVTKERGKIYPGEE